MKGRVALFVPLLMDSPEFVGEFVNGSERHKVYDSKEEARKDVEKLDLDNLEKHYYWFYPEVGKREKLFPNLLGVRSLYDLN